MTHTESRTKFKTLLDTLVNKGFSQSCVERVLAIPQKTFETYRVSKRRVPADVLALLEILNNYPWILNVAEDKFSEKSAVANMVHNVFKTLDGTKSALEILGSTSE